MDAVEAADAVDAVVRPRLRGRLHQVALVASIVGLVVLVRAAPTARACATAWIYGVAGVLLYLASSSYHVFARSPMARRVMQRIDHSMIYVLIAGTFTPLAVLAVRDPWRWPALATMWAGAATGIVLKAVLYPRLRRLASALYIVLGWAALATLPSLWHRPGLLALVIAGGLLYTFGAILFSIGRPALSPRWFGYHEVWHTFGIAAGVLLYVANLGLVRGG